MLHTDCVPTSVLSLLKRLSGHPAMGGFYLAGGTSLALRFGHRVSDDLDFFTGAEFDSERLAEELVLFGGDVVNRAPNSLTLSVGGTKVDVMRHAYEAIAPVEELNTFRLASMRDVAAMKLNAIVGRGSKKDFYDISRVLEERSLDAMLEDFARKYPRTERFVVLKSLAWFEDADGEPDPDSRLGKEWGQVKEDVLRAISP